MGSAEYIPTSNFQPAGRNNPLVDDMLSLGLQHILRAETLTQLKRSFLELSRNKQHDFIRKSDPSWKEELVTSANNMLASRLAQSLHAILDNPGDDADGSPKKGLPTLARQHVPLQVDYLFNLRNAFNHPERLAYDPQQADSLKYLLVTLRHDLHDLVKDWRNHPQVPVEERKQLAGALQCARFATPFDPLRLLPPSLFVQALDHAIAFHEMRAGAALKAAIAGQQQPAAAASKIRAKKVEPSLNEAAYDAIPTTLSNHDEGEDPPLSLEAALERAFGNHDAPASPQETQAAELERLIAASLEPPAEFAEEAVPAPAAVRPRGFREMQAALLERRYALAHYSRDDLPSPSFVDRLDAPERFSGFLRDTLKARQVTPPSMDEDYFCIMTRLMQLEIASGLAARNMSAFTKTYADRWKQNDGGDTPGR